jgi:peroxiredoxin
MRRWILLMGLVALPAWGGQDVALVRPDGSEAVLRPAEGETLLLHFWATWCPSCAADIDNLQRAVAACPQAALRVIAVNVGEDESEVAEFVKEHDILLPILRDPKGRVWREIDGRGLPMNLFWTRAGRRTDVGPKTADEWSSELAPSGCISAGRRPAE